MHILHLAPFLQGGAGLAIVQLATAQRAQGHRVEVVTSRTGAPGYGNYPGHLERLADRAVPVRLIDSLFVREPEANRAVLNFLHRRSSGSGPPDIIHSHAAVPSRIGLEFAAAPARTRVLQTMHGWGTSKTAAQAKDDVAVLNRLPCVVVPGRTSAQQLHELGVDAAKVHVIPYGVETLAEDATDVDPPGLTAARMRGRVVLCCIGTIGERKNQSLLVAALGRMPPERRPYCVLIGDGAVDELKALAERHGVSGDVRCLGYKTTPRAFLREADWMVLPSRSEGMPLAILEAFAERVPVIASDIPELREVLADGRHGLLFESDSVASLTAQLERAMAMPAAEIERLRTSGHEAFVSRYQVAAMVRAYADRYAAILEYAGCGQSRLQSSVYGHG